MNKTLPIAAFAVAMFASRTTNALDGRFHACFSPSAGWGAPSPVIDGNLDNESGWNQGFRYRFQNGVSDADVTFQAISAGSKLYIAVQVQRDASYDHLDAIVIALSAAGRYHRVIVHPSPDTGSPPGPPLTVTYDASSSVVGGLVLWPSPVHSVTPEPGPVATSPDNNHDGKFRVWTNGSGIDPATLAGSWITEIAIPLGTAPDQLSLPSGTDIGMYVSVVRANTKGGSPIYDYYSWPDALWSATTKLNLDTDTPDPTKWGVARIGDTAGCAGLRVVGLRTLDPDNLANGSELSKSHPNRFRVSVKNESVDLSGHAQTVTGVTARFFLGQWGVPVAWRPVAAANDPTDVPNDGASHDLDSSTTYTATDEDVAKHFCVMGQVDTTMGTATISQNSVIINTHWGAASTFNDRPVIQASLVKPFDGAKANTFQIKSFAKQQYAYSTGEIASLGVGALTAQADYTFEVMRRTGRTLVVSGVPGPVNVPFGSFRLIIQHKRDAEFAKEFARRHEAQRAAATASARRMLAAGASAEARSLIELRSLNAILAKDNERPGSKDFTLDLKPPTQGLAKASTFDSNFKGVVIIDVPETLDLPLDLVVDYESKPDPPCGCCHCKPQTTPVVQILGQTALIGVVVLYPRKRRRGRPDARRG